MRPLLFALLLAPSASLAQAEDAIGYIRAFFDGQERSWHTIMMPQGGRQIPTASFKQSADFAKLYVQGHVEPRFVSKGMLSLDVRFDGQFSPGDAAADVEIMYLPNGMVGRFYTSRGTEPPPTVDIVEFSQWGGLGEVVGVFSGTLCPTWQTRDAGEAVCRNVSGQFTTRLGFE